MEEERVHARHLSTALTNVPVGGRRVAASAAPADHIFYREMLCTLSLDAKATDPPTHATTGRRRRASATGGAAPRACASGTARGARFSGRASRPPCCAQRARRPSKGDRAPFQGAQVVRGTELCASGRAHGGRLHHATPACDTAQHPARGSLGPTACVVECIAHKVASTAQGVHTPRSSTPCGIAWAATQQKATCAGTGARFWRVPAGSAATAPPLRLRTTTRGRRRAPVAGTSKRPWARQPGAGGWGGQGKVGGPVVPVDTKADSSHQNRPTTHAAGSSGARPNVALAPPMAACSGLSRGNGRCWWRPLRPPLPPPPPSPWRGRAAASLGTSEAIARTLGS